MRTHEQYEQELLDKEIEYWPVEKYTRAHDKILHECIEGHKWLIEPANILRGRGCPTCKNRFTKKKNTHEHLKDLASLNPHFDLIEDQSYINNKTPLKYICKKGHVVIAKPDHILQGYGCLRCTPKGRYSAKYFEKFPEKKSAQAFLYFIKLVKSGTPFCLKLGITARNSVDKRLKELPFEYYKIKVLDMELEKAYNFERNLLERFSFYKFKSEDVFDGYTELLDLVCEKDVIIALNEGGTT